MVRFDLIILLTPIVMKNISTCISIQFVVALIFLVFNYKFNAQCADTLLAGRSINALTQVANKTKPVAVDKNLNTTIFVYRIDSTGSSAVSGMFRYGISTNNGNTFNTNSKILNPISTSWGRYPSAIIYNPTTNTTPQSAHMGYFGSTASGIGFDGIVTGASQINTSASTENYNQPGPSTYPTTGSVIRSVGGNFWSIGIGYSSGLITNNLLVYKGVWNGSNDIIWATNTVITLSANTNTSGMAVIADSRIAFAPNGTVGWISVLMSPVGSPGNNRIYPVFYKTVDGGQTWTGPILFDQNQYSCITSNMLGASLPAADRESDLTVDINGNPHLLVTIGQLGNDFNLNYGQWHNLFDITLVHGIWTAYEVAALKGSPGDCGGNIFQGASPQVSRTSDGEKIFFGWADNSSYLMGTANLSPNFFARAYDVQQRKWTQIKDFTSCNSGISGKIFFNHLAAEVLETSSTQYKLAPVFCMLTSTTQLFSPVKFYFLNSSVFSVSDFTITQPEYTVSVSPGLTAAVCPGATLNLQITNSPDQVLWSNGNTSPTRSITSTGDYFVAARLGCTVGAATITVGSLTLNVAGTTSNVCGEQAVTLEVPGNASSYTWNPGAIVGNPITVTLTTNTLYNIVAEAAGGCTLATTMQVNVNSCVGIDAFDASSSVFIYPVPSKGTVTIKTERDFEGMLHNAAGQLIKYFSLDAENKPQITVEDLAKGIYILSGTSDNKKVHRKIIVE